MLFTIYFHAFFTFTLILYSTDCKPHQRISELSYAVTRHTGFVHLSVARSLFVHHSFREVKGNNAHKDNDAPETLLQGPTVILFNTLSGGCVVMFKIVLVVHDLK
jgi:hypothetical protein